jgi:DNA-binding CsgD family transcriptional regulator/PAS domain-containing protein
MVSMEGAPSILLRAPRVRPVRSDIQLVVDALRKTLGVSALELVFTMDGEAPERFVSGQGDATGRDRALDVGPGCTARLLVPDDVDDDRPVALAEVALRAILSLTDSLQRESALQSAIDASEDAVLNFDRDSAIAYANPAAETLIARQTEDSLAVCHADDRREPLFTFLCRTVEDVLRADGASSRWHGRLVVTDGRRLGCTVHSVAQPGGDRCAVVVLAEKALGEPARLHDFAASFGLSPREEEVAKLLFSGYSAGAIAEKLGISPHTARDHVKRLYRKTGSTSRDALLERITQVTCAPPSR